MESATIWKSALQELILFFGMLIGFTINAFTAINQGFLGFMTPIVQRLSSGSVILWTLMIGIIMAVLFLSYSLGSILGVISAALVFFGAIFLLSFGWLLIGLGAAIGFAAPLIFPDPERIDDKEEMIFADMHNSL